jgi:hypothetical protein
MANEKSKDDLLQDEPLRHTNRRKKTGRWCKGKVGVEHTPELVVNHNRELYRWRNGAREVWRWHYSCKHSYRCTTCGKYTEYFLKNAEECPDFTPQPEGD